MPNLLCHRGRAVVRRVRLQAHRVYGRILIERAATSNEPSRRQDAKAMMPIDLRTCQSPPPCPHSTSLRSLTGSTVASRSLTPGPQTVRQRNTQSEQSACDHGAVAHFRLAHLQVRDMSLPCPCSDRLPKPTQHWMRSCQTSPDNCVHASGLVVRSRYGDLAHPRPIDANPPRAAAWTGNASESQCRLHRRLLPPP